MPCDRIFRRIIGDITSKMFTELGIRDEKNVWEYIENVFYNDYGIEHNESNSRKMEMKLEERKKKEGKKFESYLMSILKQYKRDSTVLSEENRKWEECRSRKKLTDKDLIPVYA